MLERIHPSLRTVGPAESALLRHLSEHMEDRMLVGAILIPSDFHTVANQEIYSVIMCLPLIAMGPHEEIIKEYLHRHSSPETLECFSTHLRDAQVLGSWMTAIQLAAHVLLMSAYRRDAENEYGPLPTPSDEDLW